MQTVLLTLSVRRSPSSVTLTTPESSWAYSEAQREVAQTGLVDTFRRSLTFEPKETVACSTQEAAAVAGKSNTAVLAFQKHLSFGMNYTPKFTARVCVVGDTTVSHLVVVMNFTCVCCWGWDGGGVEARGRAWWACSPPHFNLLAAG